MHVSTLWNDSAINATFEKKDGRVTMTVTVVVDEVILFDRGTDSEALFGDQLAKIEQSARTEVTNLLSRYAEEVELRGTRKQA